MNKTAGVHMHSWESDTIGNVYDLLTASHQMTSLEIDFVHHTKVLSLCTRKYDSPCELNTYAKIHNKAFLHD